MQGRRQGKVLVIVLRHDRIEILPLHVDAVAALHELDGVDVELLQEGPNADDVSDVALAGEDVADLLAGIGAFVADGPLRPDLLVECEGGWLVDLDHIAVADDLAQGPLSPNCSGSPSRRGCALSRTISSASCASSA